jgi:porin
MAFEATSAQTAFRAKDQRFRQGQVVLAVVLPILCVLICDTAIAQSAAGSRSAPIDRGLDNSPDDIDNQLRESDEREDSLFAVEPLQPLYGQWQRSTRALRDSIGLDLGLNYTGLYQKSDAALPGKRSEGSGGDLDFFGRWNLFNQRGPWPGALVFATETRHRYSDIPPSQLGEEIGSLWSTVVSFNTQDFALKQLYWEQGRYEDGLIYRAGKMDPSDIYDSGRFVSSNYAFLSPAFSDTLTMPLPAPGLGLAGAVYPTENTYILAGLHDANGAATSLGQLDRGEFFVAVEFGATPNYDEPGAGLYHVTLWHSDAREDANVPSGRGIALTFEQELGPDGNFVPFARYSYADAGVTSVRQTLAFGLGLEEPFGQNADLIGIGFSWGNPSDTTLKDQYVLEAFYRVFVTPLTHVTPDIQVIFDPVKNPNEDVLAVGSVRLRTLF